MSRIAVIGGFNMDITGSPFLPLREGDSNPGRCRVSYGGVGRNIAENLCRLGDGVLFLTAFGEDSRAEEGRRHCESLGMDIHLSVTIPGQSTSSYLCINDGRGDVYAAIADMEIYRFLTPELLAPAIAELNRCDAVILDANLPEEALVFLAEKIRVPLMADPVSVSKAGRLLPILGKLSAVKPNRGEAALLSGRPSESREEIAAAAEELCHRGVQRVFLSMGAEGLYYRGAEEQGFLPNFPGSIVNTTGCGDAFMAAAAHGLAEGRAIRDCACMGLAASSLCAESEDAVSPELSLENLLRKTKENMGSFIREGRDHR